MADRREEAVRKGAHGAWHLHYHIVFPVKCRKSLLDEVLTTMIQEAAAEIAEKFPIEMEAIGMDQNHIRLLCSAHPKVAPGRSVQMFKRLTAREIFRRKPAVKRVLWGGEIWTDGYDVATGGERAHWQTVERYVQRQGPPQEDLRQLRMCEFCDTTQLPAFVAEGRLRRSKLLRGDSLAILLSLIGGEGGREDRIGREE